VVVEHHELTNDMRAKLEARQAREATIKKLLENDDIALAKALRSAHMRYNKYSVHKLSNLIERAMNAGYIIPGEDEPIWHMPEKGGQSVKAFVKSIYK